MAVMKLRLLPAILAFFLLAQFAPANQGEDIQTKIAIEKNLEERLYRILTEIIGTDKLIIVIDAQLVGTDDGKDAEDEFVLPGVPLQEKLGLGLAGMQLGDTAKKIKKLSAQIIVDNSLPESMIKVVKEVSSGVLGMDEARGDILSIERIDFKRNPFSWSDIIYPPHLWGLLFTAFLGASLAVFFIFVTKTFPASAEAVSQAVRAAGEKSVSGSSGAFSSALTTAEAFSPSAGGRESGEAKGHFSFVTPDMADKLLFLLKNEKAENIAILLNYAPELSGVILSGLDKKLAGEALARLTDTRSLPGEEVSAWENKLKQKLDFFVGGKEVVADILENLSDDEMDEYIAFISEKDRAFSEELKKSVFRPSQLAGMSAEHLLLICQHFNPVSFADVLRTLPEDVRKQVLDKFPAGISSRLNEEIELGSGAGREKLISEKKSLSRLVSRLKRDGLLKTKSTEA
ncbi:MAG: hypothetical protein COZ72_05885 [Elusimicrobia bacterium CG_4_8_14_3_um_filter_50_9]|nr:MAG: hypothetical protein COZ72_05885 [Elusimicrobia bacterium CG_4_8_14_3_um_filter_50_9]